MSMQTMNLNNNLIVSLIPLFMGFIYIYGSWKNWKFFVDPHEDLWFMWFPQLIRKYWGVEALKFLNYFIGFLFLISGVRVAAL